MSGIFDHLPDSTTLLNARGSVEVDFQGAITKIPASATDLLGSFPANLTTMVSAVPSSPASLIQPLSSFFTTAQTSVGSDLPAQVQALAGGMIQIRTNVQSSPIGKIIFAPGETRSLKDILLEQVPALTAQFLSSFTGLRDSVLSNEHLQIIIDFVDTIQEFASNVPQDPNQIADFLAQSFLGLPGSLLAGPLNHADALLAQLEKIANKVADIDVHIESQNIAANFQASINLLTQFDLTVEANYHVAIDHLTALQASLTALSNGVSRVTDDLGSGLNQINLNQFETLFSAAIKAIPQVDTISLDELKIRILAPFERINQALASVSSEELINSVKAQLQALIDELRTPGLTEWQTSILGFFESIKTLIASLDLVAIRVQLEAIFNTINQRINDAGQNLKQSILDSIKSPLNSLKQAVDAIDLTAAQTSITDVFNQLNAALDKISVSALQKEIVSTIESLNDLIADLTTQTAASADQLKQIVSGLGKIQLDPVIDPVNTKIKEMTDQLKQIDPSTLSALQQGALATASIALRAIDFETSISGSLLARYDEVAALPKDKASGVAASLDTFSQSVLAFDPEILVSPLSDLYRQIKEPIDSLNISAVIQPLKAPLNKAKSAFNLLSPQQLKQPVDEIFSTLITALDKLSPALLLEPVSDAFDQFKDVLHGIDLTSLFNELITLLDDLFDRFKAELITHIEELNLPAPIKDFLASLTPLLDLISPSMFINPIDKLLEVTDSVLANTKPGDLFVPLQQLYDQLTGLLSQVDEQALVDGFEHVRSTLVTALDRVDPANLANTINGSLQTTASFYVTLNPGTLAADLNASYQSLQAAFAGLNPSAVPAQFQTLFDQIADIIASLDPAPIFNSLQPGFNTVSVKFNAVGTINLSGLAEIFAPVRKQIDLLIPAFLREPVTAQSLTAALQSLRPDAIGAEIDAVYDEFKQKYAVLRPQLGSELQALAQQQQDAFIFFSLPGLAAKFQEIYDTILQQIDALNPSILITATQGTFDTIKQQIISLNPTFLVEELTDIFNQIKNKLDALQLNTIENDLNSLLQSVKQKVAQLDPVKALRDAGLLENFKDLKAALAGISVVVLFKELDKAFAELRAELATELDKTKAAFEEMVNAIPASISLDIDIGF